VRCTRLRKPAAIASDRWIEGFFLLPYRRSQRRPNDQLESRLRQALAKGGAAKTVAAMQGVSEESVREALRGS